MALGDFSIFNAGSDTGAAGSRRHLVAAGGTPPAINAYEPVSKTLGNEYVITNPTSGQVVGTNYLAGVATSTSTETASLDGYVDVVPVDGQIWLIAPTAPTSWNTQALYNANVGKRVLIQKSSGVYTILAADSANNGCVVEYLDVTKYPGQVAFSLRNGLSYLA